MKTCLTCSDFDAEYKGGYCDRHRMKVSPNCTCDDVDERARKYDYHTCAECYNFDPHYKNGYCNHWEKAVSPAGTCSSFR